MRAWVAYHPIEPERLDLPNNQGSINHWSKTSLVPAEKSLCADYALNPGPLSTHTLIRHSFFLGTGFSRSPMYNPSAESLLPSLTSTQRLSASKE